DEVAEEVRVRIQFHGVSAVYIEKFAAQFFRRVAILHALQSEKHRLLRAAAGADMHGDKSSPRLKYACASPSKRSTSQVMGRSLTSPRTPWGLTISPMTR